MTRRSGQLAPSGWHQAVGMKLLARSFERRRLIVRNHIAAVITDY
jgi:hypothetical protein